jgi:gas vesicle protein
MRVLFAALLAALVAVPAAGQTRNTVTQSDIQRLQDSVYQASTDVSQLRSRDATRARQLETELDELREEVIYLKVKLRKESSLARVEYSDVRDKIEDLRTRARGDATGAYSVTSPSGTGSAGTRATTGTGARGTTATTGRVAGVEIPAGTEIDVRLLNTLDSGTAQVEDRFEATTLADLTLDGRVAIPAGAVMRGVVTSVEQATRTNRTSKLTVSFDQITVNNRSYPVRATVTQAIEGEGIKGEAGRIGVGAGVGAVIGGILGGVKGALAGILIGGGGTIAATEGKEVELPQGTVLRVRFDSAASIAR